MQQDTTSSPNSINTMLGDVYYRVLQLFISTDERVNWMSKPFKNGGKGCSTNGWALCAIPDFEIDCPVLEDKLKTVYPIEYNQTKFIYLSQLKEAFSKAPLLDDYDETEVECSACYGEGEVEYEFSHGRKDYTIESECPVCEGQGVIIGKSDKPNGKKIIDYTKLITIGNSTFNIERLQDVVKVAELLGVKNISLVFQGKPSQGNLFKVGDAEILIMPVMPSDIENVCANIA